MTEDRLQKDTQERDGTGEKVEDRRQEGKTGYRCMKTSVRRQKERKEGRRKKERK